MTNAPAYNESFWTDTPDALDELLNAPTTAKVIPTAFDKASPYYEPCDKCRGTGRFVSYSGRVVGPCFHCKGLGGFMRKTTQAERAHAKALADQRKADKAALTLDGFAAEFPVEFAWIEAKKTTFDFAKNMEAALVKYGYLTDGQMATVRRLMTADADRADLKVKQAAQRAEAAPVIEQAKLVAAFDAAKANGLKKPQLRFEGFTASLAPSTGKNPGAIYIKAHGDYAGKIADGKFWAFGEAGKGIVDAVAKAMVDPVEAAIAYGRATGNCSCCGRTLTDPESVAAGVGPICASKFGF